MPPHPVRIGIFGIGLDAYWPQFAGLKERLEGYVAHVATKLKRPGVDLFTVVAIATVDATGSWFVGQFSHAFPFYIYAAFCVVLILVVWRFVPETKGRTLEQIEQDWSR